MKFSMTAALRPMTGSRPVQLRELVERERAVVFLSCGVLALLAIAEGVSAMLDGPRLIVVWIVALAVTAGYDLYHLRYLRRAIGQLERNALDEEKVRAKLASVGALGARVFTSVVCGRQLVPVVIIAPQGVYAIDVRIAATSPQQTVEVTIDEKRFRYDGATVTPNPLHNLLDCVQVLQRTLRIGRNDDVVVRPVLVVAGAAIEVQRLSGAPDISVVSLEALDQFLKTQPEVLAITEVLMHAVRLAAHVKEGSDGM